MTELEQMLVEKLGITQDVAHKAILIITDYAKSKLPEPMFRDVSLVLKIPEIKEEEAKELGLFRFP